MIDLAFCRFDGVIYGHVQSAEDVTDEKVVVGVGRHCYRETVQLTVEYGLLRVYLVTTVDVHDVDLITDIISSMSERYIAEGHSVCPSVSLSVRPFVTPVIEINFEP